MNESKVCGMQPGMEYQCVTEDSKVRVYLSEVRWKEKKYTETTFEKAMIIVLELFYSFAITYMVGSWAIAEAYAERGYKAYGGEYLLIGFTFWIAFKSIHGFFRYYRRRCNNAGSHKKGSRGIIKVRNIR